MNSARCLWEVRGRVPEQSSITLLLLPHSGGSAQAFAEWGQLFPPAVRLIAAQYPGRASRNREPLPTDLRIVSAELVDSLADLQGPLAIFGHSLGAIIGFEICWQLEGMGRPPVAFFASAAVALHERRPYAVSPRDMTDDELLKMLMSYGGMATGVVEHAELLRHTLTTCRSDIALAHEYVYGRQQRRLSIPIVSMAGELDPVAPIEGVAQWCHLSTGPSSTHTFPSGHFYHIDHLATVTAVVLDHLSPGSRTGSGNLPDRL